MSFRLACFVLISVTNLIWVNDATAQANAEPFRVVVRAYSGDPALREMIPNAEVEVFGTPIRLRERTRENGGASFHLSPGTYLLVVSHPEHDPFDAVIEVISQLEVTAHLERIVPATRRTTLGLEDLARLILALVTVFICAVVVVPMVQVRKISDHLARLKAEDEARRTIAQIGGGLFVAASLFLTGLQFADTQQQNQYSQRFTILNAAEDRRVAEVERLERAVTQLTADNAMLRLAALETLQTSARDSARHREFIFSLLTHFCRRPGPVRASDAERNAASIALTNVAGSLGYLPGGRRQCWEAAGLR